MSRMPAACNGLTNNIYEKYFTCFQGFYFWYMDNWGLWKNNWASYERKAGEQLPVGMSIGGDKNALLKLQIKHQVEYKS